MPHRHSRGSGNPVSLNCVRDYSARPCASPCGLPAVEQICSGQICRTHEHSHPLSPPHKKSPDKGLFYMWRRERDSNPRYAVSVYTLSRRAPSTTRTPLREFILFRSIQSVSILTTEHLCVLVTPGSCPPPLRGQLTKFAVPNRSRRFGQPLGHLSNVRF